MPIKDVKVFIRSGLYPAASGCQFGRMKSTCHALALTLAMVAACATAVGQGAGIARGFQVVERTMDAASGETRYFGKIIRGTERKNNSLNRLVILSEDQFDYPAPESGCAPTAMLNILIWYEKYGLIEPFNREADLRQYKLKLFHEIDYRLTKHAGMVRTEESGIKSVDAAMVMDAMVQEHSNGQFRIHSEYFEPPLQLSHFLDTMPNFRSGYLIVTPKDKNTGKQLGPHAATVVRADRAGNITLGTWGKLYHGLLRKRPDGQWFIPQDPEHMELKVIGLTRFIPFKPTTPADR